MDAGADRRSQEIRAVSRVTYGGMAVNALVALVKGVVGIWGHSQALVADAVHSLSDLTTDFAVVFGVRFWTAPADEDHPYGHGKMQALVTLFIGAALLAVAVELAKDAVSVLRGPSRSAPGAVALFAALISIIAKEILYRWTRRVADRVGSPALAANAWHHRSDALSSIPVALAVAVTLVWPSLWWIDSVGALVVSVCIVHVAWQIARPALADLLDAGVREKAEKVAAIARAVPGVCAVHKVRARRSGGTFQADLHLEVRPTLTVAEGHALGGTVKRAILSAGLDVTDALIHLEPAEENNITPAFP
ncbi:MAG: cation diffusion facilitator family transporter [Kiritimatiellia bacterium]